MSTMKNWSQAEIRLMLENKDHWVERAIKAIHKYQTSQEKQSFETTELNGVGFNGFDAPLLSSFAEWLNKGRHLSPKQLGIARKRILKYSGQLTKIANN